MNETLDELMMFGPTRLNEVARRQSDFDAIQALLDELEYPSDPSLTHESSPKLVQRAQEQHRAHRDRVAELTSALEGRAAEVAQLKEQAKRADEKATQYCHDWYLAKQEFGTAAAKLREQLRAAEAKVARLESAIADQVIADGVTRGG